MTGTALMEQH